MTHKKKKGVPYRVFLAREVSPLYRSYKEFFRLNYYVLRLGFSIDVIVLHAVNSSNTLFSVELRFNAFSPHDHIIILAPP